ncbi:MAG: hypothetical protein KGJ24_05765 [Burkholderiales bacterium]|nr:hypothetical protein [Burkholderiales bacterium]
MAVLLLAPVWALAAAASASAPDGAAGLRFEQVFDSRGEPPALHYRVAYAAGEGASAPMHRLEVWRDGERRLVRRTDDAIETHVEHRPGDPAYRMVVLDLQRRIETRLSRDDLYRLGQFTDWYDLAHGLHHPMGPYRLTAEAEPAHAPRPVAACRWYALAQAGRRTQVCWSASVRLPLLLLDDGGRLQWQVTAIDRGPAPAARFELRDRGFVRNDAGADISGD